MLDFSKIRSSKSITPDWLLSKISDAQIWSYYFGKFELGKSYNARHRKDSNPSVAFFINSKGSILLKDFSKNINYNCFSYVQLLFNCNFDKALNIIASDFGLIENSVSKVSKDILDLEFDTTIKKNTLIQFIPDKWKSRPLNYWNLFEINQDELIREEVFYVKKLFINKKEIKNYNNELRFAFVEENVGIKIYSPFDKKMKWINNIPIEHPFNINKLKFESDTLIITKSKKDLIILKKFFTDVIATQNESEASISEENQILFLEKYKKRIIIWDADEVGVEACKKFNDKGFDYFNTPNQLYKEKGIKDVSDYVKWFGTDSLKELLITKNIL